MKQIFLIILIASAVLVVSCDDQEKFLGSGNDDGNNNGGEQTWTRTFGSPADEVAVDLVETAKLGYYVLGNRLVLPNLNSNFYLGEFSPSGNLVRGKIIETDNNESAKALIKGYNNTLLAVGSYSVSDSTQSDVLIYNFDDTGKVIYSNTYGGFENETANDVIKTGIDEYIITGGEGGVSDPLQLLLLRIDEQGQYLSKITYGAPAVASGNSVINTIGGGHLSCGWIISDEGEGDKDVYLLKTDSLGEVEWYKIFGGSGVDIGYSVIETSDSAYFITATSNSFQSGSIKAYFIKVDRSGDLIWEKTLNNAKTESAFAALETFDGGYVITGWTIYTFNKGGSDLYLFKLDKNGNLIWERFYGGGVNDVGNSVIYTADFGFAIAGYTKSFGMGGSDIYLIRTNISGELRPTYND